MNALKKIIFIFILTDFFIRIKHRIALNTFEDKIILEINNTK